MHLDASTEPSTPAALDIFDALRRQGMADVNAGNLENALGLFEEALVVAQQSDDPDMIDLAVCNRSAVTIELGQGSEELAALRSILMKGEAAANRWLAAYHIGRYYELAKSYKKALFYARIARDRAVELDRTEWRASSHNLIGNLLLAESFVDQAMAEYGSALELMPEEVDVRRARILDNMGYCHLLKGHHQEGFRLLYQSLRTLRHYGARRYQISAHIDLSYAHLEVGRYGQAARHGRAALQLAEMFDDGDGIKNALYLLGQGAVLAGNVNTARRYFDRLEGHFPGGPMVSDFLLATDVRGLINLKA